MNTSSAMNRSIGGQPVRSDYQINDNRSTQLKVTAENTRPFLEEKKPNIHNGPHATRPGSHKVTDHQTERAYM